jgi:barstar (barnase inhibitor)
MARVRLNSDQITDWQSFHQSCKETMGFPDFYGMNMDAWIDCMSYLDEDAGMARFLLFEGEAVHIEITSTESFKSRSPEILDALIECSAFVNQRYVERGKLPPISLVFL